MLGRGFKVRLNTAADMDFTAAQEYHTSVSEALADRFYANTMEALHGLSRMWAYQLGPHGLRKFRIPGFEYYLIYSVDETAEEITVEGILHSHSNRIFHS